MSTTDDTETDEPTHGHIRGENRPDLDVFLNDERMRERDAVDDGMVMEDWGDERVVKLTVIYTDGLRCGATVWNDPDDAFLTDGEFVDFDRVGDASDVFARFEARERDLTVELREVGDGE